VSVAGEMLKLGLAAKLVIPEMLSALRAHKIISFTEELIVFMV
jgi:hypothetical protein